MRRVLSMVLGVTALLIATMGAGTASASGSAGAVFTMSNAAGGNRILAWSRGADGTLHPAGSYAAGGLGSGAGLGSQGSLTLTPGGRWLFAVDAGSDEVSVFRVNGASLVLKEVESTGDMPISVTVHGRWVYVLHAGGTGGIEGFRRHRNGILTSLAGSALPLTSDAAGPAQISFTPDGRHLLVTEKAANTIARFNVDHSGIAHPRSPVPSQGETPFGFAFARGRTLIVSEAFGGAPDSSAISTYRVHLHGGLTAVSSSVPTTETAACWVAVTPNGRFAYTTNTGSGSVTGFEIGSDGSATILDADGVTASVGPSGTPIDAGVSRDGDTLYVLASGTHEISAFRIHPDGSLSVRPGVNGLPASAVGLAVR